MTDRGREGLRPVRAMAACAATALAVVFSVQQGEHGPLVVYKLQAQAQVAPSAAPTPSAGPLSPDAVPAVPVPATQVPTVDLHAIPSRAPKVLGTVVLPARRAVPAAAPSLAAAPLHTPPDTGILIVRRPASPTDEVSNWQTGWPTGWRAGWRQAGGLVTLQEVSEAVTWRRETADRLPKAPFAPRF
jgi:hypothetical protein